MVVQVIPLIADLRDENKNLSDVYFAEGLSSEGDSGSGHYYWNETSTLADDGFNVLQVTGVPTGRWIRIYAGYNIYSADGSLAGDRTVTLNGHYLAFAGASYSSTFNADGSVTLGSLVGSGTRMVVAGPSGVLGTQAIAPGTGTTTRFIETFTATAGQTTFATANTLLNDFFDVFVNGVRLDSLSYTNTSNQVVLTDGCAVNDIVDIVGFTSLGVATTLPSQTGNAGKYLRTDGTNIYWDVVSSANNIYNANGTLTGNRIMTMAGYTLSFNGGNVSIGNTHPLSALHVGDRNVNNSTNPVILISRNVTSAFASNTHAFSDSSLLQLGTGLAYNSYDARVDIGGSNSIDHYAGFQHGINVNTSGTIMNVYGLFTNTTISAGAIENNYSVYAYNPTGAGTITNNFGLYVSNLSKGSNNYGVYLDISSGSGKWNIYSNGTADSYINGNVGIGATPGAYKLDVTGTFRTSGVNTLSNLSGTGTRMVVADASGILSTQPLASGSVTSVGLSMPSAFTVTNSPITSSGTLTVTGSGTTAQYVRGDGTLGIFPNQGGGGGGTVYYFNGNTSQGSIGGTTMYQLSESAGTGVAANFTRSTTGVIASFITDVNKPNQLTVPAGIWVFECYFSETGGGANHAQIQAIVEKWNGTTITVIGTGVVEEITNGSTKDLYTLGVTIPNGTTLSLTDRIVVQIQISNANGKTVTLYTEDSNLSSVTTTFANGISSLNGLTASAQTFGVSTSGTDFSITSSTSVHTFNLPTASATNRGALSSADWSTFNGKQNALTNPVTGTGTSNELAYFSGTSAISSLTTATYPSLTELSYVKGVTSAIQTQLNAKGSGTVTSVAALTLGTTGTDVSSTVANGTTTPVITLNIPTASATNRGALSSTDWSAFNSKQGALTLTTTGTSGAATLVGNTLNIPQYSGGGGMAIGGSITSATAGSVLFAGTSGVLAQDNSNLFWDNTNKRLGIGTATPSVSLDARGVIYAVFPTSKSTGSLVEGFRLNTNDATNPNSLAISFLGSPTASSRIVMLQTSESGVANGGMLVLQGAASGNVLVGGNYASSYRFEVSGTVRTTGNTFLSTSANTIIGSTTDSGERLQVTGTAKITSTLNVGSNSLYVDTTNLRVGVRNSTPGAAVDVWNNSNTENAQLRISDSRLIIPNYSSLGASPAITINTLGSLALSSSSTGGLQLIGFTTNTNTGAPFTFNGYHGGTSPTTAAMKFIGWKHDGSTNRTALTGSEIIAGFSAGFNTDVFQVKANGRINMSSLPTSSTGLSSGDLWNDAGTLKIV